MLLNNIYFQSIWVTSNTTNPARSSIFNNRFAKLFDKQPNQTRPVGYRVRDDLRDIGFVPKHVLLTFVIPTLPWLLTRPTVNLSLTELVKSETNPDIFKSKYLQLCDELSDCRFIYNDGSKMSNGAAAAAVSQNVVKTLRSVSLRQNSLLLTLR